MKRKLPNDLSLKKCSTWYGHLVIWTFMWQHFTKLNISENDYLSYTKSAQIASTNSAQYLLLGQEWHPSGEVERGGEVVDEHARAARRPRLHAAHHHGAERARYVHHLHTITLLCYLVLDFPFLWTFPPSNHARSNLSVITGRALGVHTPPAVTFSGAHVVNALQVAPKVTLPLLILVSSITSTSAKKLSVLIKFKILVAFQHILVLLLNKDWISLISIEIEISSMNRNLFIITVLKLILKYVYC